MNIYVELTQRFNEGRLRAVLAGGQAVVLHRLAIMSKDGDWILLEDEEALEHVLGVLEEYGSCYRFGAPLDLRWMSGGWSSHLEFRRDGLRVRTDFVTRPPRLSEQDLTRLWRAQIGLDIPRADPQNLAEMKKTNREKDYAVIGELARIMTNVEDQILYSRSARDLLSLHARCPKVFERLMDRRTALRAFQAGQEELEQALDKERRQLMHANERRLMRYMSAAQRWTGIWPEISKEMQEMNLPDAHEYVCTRAAGVLPFNVEDMES